MCKMERFGNGWKCCLNVPGLQSVRSEHIERRTFEIVKAGDQLSFRISKQITP